MSEKFDNTESMVARIVERYGKDDVDGLTNDLRRLVVRVMMDVRNEISSAIADMQSEVPNIGA